MKNKITLSKGLSLNKEAFEKLQDDQMTIINGGGHASIYSCWYLLSCLSSCGTNSCNTTTPERKKISGAEGSW